MKTDRQLLIECLEYTRATHALTKANAHGITELRTVVEGAPGAKEKGLVGRTIAMDQQIQAAARSRGRLWKLATATAAALLAKFGINF